MSTPDATAVAALARRCQLVTDEQWQECVSEAGKGMTDPAAMLRIFERKGYLTTWQSSKLTKGDTDGYILGGFKLLYKIAAGSFGRVFRGVDPLTGDSVAVKVLRRRMSDDPKKIELFKREGKVGMTMRHPNIVCIHTVSQDPATQQHFIVMEFVEGGSFRDFLSIRKKLPAKEAVRFLEEMAGGLAYAVTKGLTHRDLKPSNVLISSTGVCKLVDFGLAEVTGEDEATVDRTVDYAGLEKATGAKAGDVRSDIYFLGCVFYEMLTGRPPLEATKDKRARMDKRRFEQVKPLTPTDVDAPPCVFALLERMMALEPSQRFQTAAQCHDAVRKVQAELDGVKVEALAPAGPRTVFVVEQNARLQDAMREKFKEKGFRVLLSADPARAVTRYGEQPFHALVMDAGTAGPDGVDALLSILNAAEREGAACAGLLIVNEDQAAWADRVPRKPCVAALVRPVTLKQLYTKLVECVDAIAPA